MTNTLLPCPSCARHVRASSTTCPFCATAITLVAPTPRVITERLGRAALFTLGAAAIVTAPGCIMASPAYGIPAYDSGPVAQDAGTQPDSGSTPDAAAAPDAGTDGGLAGAYGAPPPNDGG